MHDKEKVMIASKGIQLQSLLHVLSAPPSQMISTATPELLIWSLLSMVYIAYLLLGCWKMVSL
jgi:hypothetical protein